MLDVSPVTARCSRMIMHKALVAGCFTAFGLLALPSLGAQEKQLTSADRSHTDAKFSPDGKVIAYQAEGALFTQLAGGGGERQIFKLSSAFRYFWDAGGLTWTVFQGDLVKRFDSRAGSQVLANLKGQNVTNLFYLTKNGQFLYGIRMKGLIEMVFRVDLKIGGKLSDLFALGPITSVDVDPSETKILYSVQSLGGPWTFHSSNMDGSKLTEVFRDNLVLANKARWLDNGQSFVYISLASQRGPHVHKYVIATKKVLLLTGPPRFRKSVPSPSPDMKWIAMREEAFGKAQRILYLPSSGGGELVLGTPHFSISDEISFSPDGKRLAFVGATQAKGKPQVFIYDFARPMRLAPALRVGQLSTLRIDLAKNEFGVVFLGFGISKKPLKIPGLSGSFDLLLTQPVLPIMTSVGISITGPIVIPNDAKLAGLSFNLQGLRLDTKQAFAGAFTLPLYADILR